jgi:predicted RNase H-like HicB family nuclease
MTTKTFTAVIRQEEDLFVADCPEVGTVSQGKSVEEAIANLKEATELHLEEVPHHKVSIKTWGDVGTCSHCGKIAPVAFTVDPYAFEIDNNEDEDYYCEGCYDQRKGDI